jgi:hypothetical protein
MRMSSVTSTALYSERDVSRGDCDIRAIVSRRIGWGMPSLPDSVRERADFNRLTRILGSLVRHSMGRFDKSKSVHSDESKATLRPTVKPHFEYGIQYLLTRQALPRSACGRYLKTSNTSSVGNSLGHGTLILAALRREKSNGLTGRWYICTDVWSMDSWVTDMMAVCVSPFWVSTLPGLTSEVDSLLTLWANPESRWHQQARLRNRAST